MTRSAAVRWVALIALIAVLAVTGCSVARKADQARPTSTRPVLPVPTAIAPPQAEGLNGIGGSPPPNACTAVAGSLTGGLGRRVTARPGSWNDGGLPALDLCMLLLGDRPVVVGVSALPSRPDSLDRLTRGVSSPGVPAGGTAQEPVAPLPELSDDARLGPRRVTFSAGDRVVRITAADRLDRATALTLGRAVRAVVPRTLRAARQSDGACQPAGATVETFLGGRAALRRDYRVDGALTCIWGTAGATVSIVESFRPDTIPEARRTPAPRLAPIGQPGYYLPEEGELVFRQGRRVVRVTALTDPSQQATLDDLVDLVEPVMPLFIR
jgi:hypothetical protein